MRNWYFAFQQYLNRGTIISAYMLKVGLSSNFYQFDDLAFCLNSWVFGEKFYHKNLYLLTK